MLCTYYLFPSAAAIGRHFQNQCSQLNFEREGAKSYWEATAESTEAHVFTQARTRLQFASESGSRTTGGAAGECTHLCFLEPGWSRLQHHFWQKTSSNFHPKYIQFCLPLRQVCVSNEITHWSKECILCQIPYHLCVFSYFHGIKKETFAQDFILVWRGTNCRQNQLESRPTNCSIELPIVRKTF